MRELVGFEHSSFVLSVFLRRISPLMHAYLRQKAFARRVSSSHSKIRDEMNEFVSFKSASLGECIRSAGKREIGAFFMQEQGSLLAHFLI